MRNYGAVKIKARATLLIVVQVLLYILAPLSPGREGTAFLGPAAAHAAGNDPREMRAREAFAAGRYQDAIDMFAKLYAETLHPTFLRNIGRCYQNMEVPDKAISSFRDYLRKAGSIPAAERAEVEGFIAEMEALHKRQAAAAAAKPVVEPAPAPTPAPAPADVDLAAPAPAPADEESGGLTSKWWFWGAVAGVVIAGVVVGLAASGAFSSGGDPDCAPPRMCVGN